MKRTQKKPNRKMMKRFMKKSNRKLLKRFSMKFNRNLLKRFLKNNQRLLNHNNSMAMELMKNYRIDF